MLSTTVANHGLTMHNLLQSELTMLSLLLSMFRDAFNIFIT